MLVSFIGHCNSLASLISRGTGMICALTLTAITLVASSCFFIPEKLDKGNRNGRENHQIDVRSIEKACRAERYAKWWSDPPPKFPVCV
jgi:hypothetical protein